jgi:hypothetical protein
LSDPALRESWPRAIARGVGLAAWVFALLILAAVTAYTWSRWRNLVEHLRMDLDPRPRVDEGFPKWVDDVPRRVADATRDLKSANREYLADLGICAAVALGLIGLPILYRRHVPQALRWPATKRAWLLAAPLAVALAVVAGLLLVMAAGSAIKG